MVEQWKQKCHLKYSQKYTNDFLSLQDPKVNKYKVSFLFNQNIFRARTIQTGLNDENRKNISEHKNENIDEKVFNDYHRKANISAAQLNIQPHFPKIPNISFKKVKTIRLFRIDGAPRSKILFKNISNFFGCSSKIP